MRKEEDYKIFSFVSVPDALGTDVNILRVRCSILYRGAYGVVRKSVFDTNPLIQANRELLLTLVIEPSVGG